MKKIAKKQAKKQVSKLALGNQVVTHVESITIPDGAADGAVATCAPGEVLIGGGVTPVGSGEGELGTVVASGPIDPLQPLFGVPTDGSKLDAWGGFFRNDEGTLGGGAGAPATLNVFAVCSR